MKIQRNELKNKAILLRKEGNSLSEIYEALGVPKSTLSGWLKDTPQTLEAEARFSKQRLDNLAVARQKARQWHSSQKELRILQSKQEASAVLKDISPSDNAILELSLAILYFSEGAKNNTTSLGSSDPLMIQFFITSLEKLYGLKREAFRYDLHVRADQNTEQLKGYWSSALKIQYSDIGYVSKDKRTAGKPTKPGYMGVCQVNIGRIDIQRKLKALYTLYCSHIVEGA